MSDTADDINLRSPDIPVTSVSTPPPISHPIDARVLFDASPIPTWILDAETFAFLAVNRAAVNHYGYSEEEFLRLTVRDICVAEDFPLFLEQLTQIPFGFEWRALIRHNKKDRSLIYIEPARQETYYNGRRAIFSVLIDVTERIRAEEALKASEERTQLILNTSLDAVVEMDGNSRIIGWNPQAERCFGWTREEAIGRCMPDTIIPPQYRQAHNDGLARFAKTGEGPLLNRRIKITALRRDGEEFPVEIAITPIQTAQGVTFSAFVRDITEQEKAQAALEESEAQYRAILDNTPSVIYVKDIKGRYLFVNRAFELLNDCAYQSARGKTDFELFPHELSEPIVANDRRVIESGEPIQFEESGPFEGRTLTYISTKFPLRDAEGRIYALCGVSTDITRRKQEEITRQFLTEASEVLASSLDYEQTLQKVADLAVPHIADWCGVDMLEEDGSIRQLAVAHVDPEKVKWANELRKLYPPRPGEPGLPTVLHTGRSEIYADLSDDLLATAARDAQHLEVIHKIGFRSVMIVPILARDHILGAITFVTTNESGHNYSAEDLVLAEGLAARAALAIDNARLFRAAQEELAERRRVQDALALSEERFRFALAHSDIAVYMQDRDLRYTWVYNGLLNGEMPALYGKTDADFLEAEDAAYLAQIKRRVIQTGSEERHTARATYLGREPGFYDTLFAPLRDPAGSIIGVTGTVNNITERKMAQDALVAHQTEIEALNQRLQRSMRETHHRVKNNLQVISALINMQEMEHEEMVPTSELHRITHHINALAAIHDLLTYQAQTDPEVTDISIRSIMDKLVPTIQGMVAGREIHFEVEDLRIPVRQGTTFAVLVNELVSNSLKHGAGVIHLRFHVLGGQAELEVTDEGEGFPEGFTPQQSANTGLDLIQSLSRWDLRGTVRFENREEGGSRVVVAFPIPDLDKAVGAR